MCRMMGVMAPHGIDAELLGAFRQQARGHVAPGDSPGHGDGWGILHYAQGRPTYAGRSTGDALTDPLYPAAVDELRKTRPHGPVLAHVRKASAGALSVDNTHPFALGRWSFCHNGTVFGFAPPGQSDSLAIFKALHDDISKRRDTLGAIRRLLDEVSCMKYTSLTFLLTDGDALYGLRKVGTVDEECHENACSPEYYTLGVSKIGEAVVVSQEHEFLGLGGTPWRVVPDGDVVVVSPDATVEIVKA